MILSFENESILEKISLHNSSASISNRHFKDGNHSLRWDFKAGGKMTLSAPVDYKSAPTNGKDSRVSTFGVYMYCENAVNENITVSFNKGTKLCCYFTINTNFTGWRSVFVKYDIDMTGTADTAMDNICFQSDNADGTVYFDQLVTSNFMDVRSVGCSFQVPFVHMEREGKIVENDYSIEKLYKTIPRNGENTRVATSLVNEIKGRYEYFLLHNYSEMVKSKGELLEYYQSLQLQFFDGFFHGVPVEYERQRCILEGLAYKKEYGYVNLSEYNKMLFSFAITYAKTKDKDLADCFIAMLRHLIDQGLNAGSTMGIIGIMDYAMRMFYPAVFLMEEEIKKVGLWATVVNIIHWFSEFGIIFVRDTNQYTISADHFNTRSQSYLISALTDNSEELIRELSAWINYAMRPTVGLMGIFKDDGCIYHHCMHYPAYGMDGLTGVMPIIYAFSGTKYQISDDAWSILYKVMTNMRFYVNKYDFPLSLSGRHPSGKWKINLDFYRYWALAGIKRGDMRPIPIYKRLIAGRKTVAEDEEIIKVNIEAEPAPQGHLTLNRGCCAFHRFGDTLVSVKGFSKYLWGHETYIKDNLYGRYLSHGQLEIIRGSLQESGFAEEGFDWARLCGTTAIHLPTEKMKCDIYNLDAYSGFEEMLISDQPFAGGVDDGENGMFSFVLHGHPKYDGSHKATLSYIFMGDFVLCLGSGISNDEMKYPTNTTLFQRRKNGKTPMVTNGQIEDGYGNIFYSDCEITVESGKQSSQYENGTGANEGDVVVAYINHGSAPKNAEFVYGIGVEGGKKPLYTILQNDEVAQAVQVGKVLYCSVFKPAEFKGCGAINSVSEMSIIMCDGEHLHICQPDLGFYDEDISQYDENGVQKEVSIYSRKWLAKPLREYVIDIKINNKTYAIATKGGEITELMI